MRIVRLRWILSLTVIIVSSLFIAISCRHEGIPADQMEPVCFNQQVLPIFQNSCATSGCHNAQGGESGYVFTDYSNIMKAITPGNASKSKAYKAITSSFQLMPPHNPLPMDKRILIRVWIDQGAKETNCDTQANNPDTKAGNLWACYERDIQPIFNNSCAVSGCHNSVSHKEGIDLSSYAKAFAAIKPGNPEQSKIYKAITKSPNSEDFMPRKPYGALSQASIDSIYSWIKRGGLYEECASVCDTTGNITYASHIKPIIDRTCVSCHGAGNPSGGIKLLTKTDVQAAAVSGKLLAAIQRKGKIVMPPSSPLEVCQVREFELWINQGYQ